MGRILLFGLVQFSSSAEAGGRGSPARGLSKLSSVATRSPSSRLVPRRSQVRSTFRKRPRQARMGTTIGASP